MASRRAWCLLSRNEILTALRKMGFQRIADLKLHCRQYERYIRAVEGAGDMPERDGQSAGPASGSGE